MAKVKPDEKNIHAGHRMRVIRSYSRIDLDTLSPHQVMEYILFYVFPRGDVNPLAHRLIDKFGSVQDVIDAEVDDLKKVYGINDRSARQIKGFSNIFDLYTSNKLSKKMQFTSYEDIAAFCKEILSAEKEDAIYMIAVDASFHMVAKEKMSRSKSGVLELSLHQICNFLNETKAPSLVLAHNHIGRTCQPSTNDIDGTKSIATVMGYIGINVIDHMVVGDDGVFSIMQNKKIANLKNDYEQIVAYLRDFDKGEYYKDIISNS